MTHTPFRRLTEHELRAADDVTVLRYVAQAKRIGRSQDAETAMWMLWYRHGPRMRRRVALRLPDHLTHHLDTVAEWVGTQILRSALRLQLEGTSPGEWTRYWQTAVDRQVVSFWRSKQGQELERQNALPSEHEGEEGAGADRLGVSLDVERLAAQADYHAIISSVLAAMANEQHAGIARCALYEDLSSVEIAIRFATSAANVDQVKSRFRALVRAALQDRGITDS